MLAACAAIESSRRSGVPMNFRSRLTRTPPPMTAAGLAAENKSEQALGLPKVEHPFGEAPEYQARNHPFGFHPNRQDCDPDAKSGRPRGPHA